MTPLSKDQTDHYIAIGLATNLKDKAVGLEKTMKEACDSLRVSSGFTSNQFLPILASIRERCDDFEEAMRVKEEFAKSIRSSEPK